MKEIQEIKNYIMILKKTGCIVKVIELELLRKLTSLEHKRNLEMEQAYNDGKEDEQQRSGYFNIENYK
tara:strand:+ start:482 stop:685 length:204 start_codon:yes stop_codon:yes gene_type:complete